MTNIKSSLSFRTMLKTFNLLLTAAILAACSSGQDKDAAREPAATVSQQETLVQSEKSKKPDMPKPQLVGPDNNVSQAGVAPIEEPKASIGSPVVKTHPSIAREVYNALTVVAEGPRVCVTEIVDVSAIPKIGYENIRQSGAKLFVPLGKMVCDPYPGAELCYFNTLKPIYFQTGDAVRKITVLPSISNAEIHYSEFDIICRVTRRK